MTRPTHTILLLALAFGCADEKNALDIDDDGDGVTEFEGDCDDADPDTYPGAAKSDSTTACMTDSDGDGWGSQVVTGDVEAGTDCDDENTVLETITNDADCDGVLTSDDCDDGDASSTAAADDGDCDGVLTSDDCDDGDASSTAVADDGDCDGVLTSDDCDDGDSSKPNDDMDCDGVSTSDDCDDSDATMPNDDSDCDGTLTPDDCDDEDSASTVVSEDGDCDGVLTADDCDDSDAGSMIVAEDGDCDGVLTADDCDDEDAASTVISEDGDCDGALSIDDCDDADPWLGSIYSDADCDGIYTAIDCDDSDATKPVDDADCDGLTTEVDCDDDDATKPLDDVDCDGALTADDCDDGDSSLGLVVNDHDCDGVLTADDCDDDDDSLGAIVADGDCDGTLTADDCDDDDAASTTVATDADCDGVLTEDDCDDDDASLTLDDADGDGYSTCDGDCNDDDTSYHPDAIDGFIADKNCDGVGGTGGSLGDATYKFVGESEWDEAGTAVVSAGDVDGDGIGDILVGGTHTYAAYLVLGSSLGSFTTIDLSTADYTFVGEGPWGVGKALASAGDVDGDGLDDILIGEAGNSSGGYGAGAAYLVLGSSLGSSATIDLSTADYKFVGEYGCIESGMCSDHAGSAVASAGDVDGDGLDDILVGAPEYGGAMIAKGAAYVVLGASLGSISTIDLSDADYKFIGEDDWDHAGGAVSSAGDVDDDGLDDLLIGATAHGSGVWPNGAAYLVLGASLGTSSTIDLSDADYKFIGESDSDGAGSAVAPAGDFDGDGLDDILIGAYQNDYSGSAYLVLGSSLGSPTTRNLSTADVKFVGEYGSHVGGSWWLHARVSSDVGDIDGDEIPDFLFGGPDWAIGTGAAYLVLGSTIGFSSTIDLSTEAIKFSGESEGDMAGSAVAFVDDVNGDGLDDLLMGAPNDDGGGSYAGAVYIFLSEG